MSEPAARATPAQRQRLRALWRSAGWPSRDMLEIELLAAGWVERRFDDAGRETLRLTDAGIAQLAVARRQHQGARSAHEAMAARVAQAMQRDGRIAWRGLALRAPLAEPDAAAGSRTRWVVAMPDVYSIRHTTREDLLLPIAHEVKVSRADLLSDLRRPAKAEAYRALASECWYVLAPGIGAADEIPTLFGVLQAGPGDALEVLRPAPRRPFTPALGLWMALARATPEPPDEESPQAPLAPVA
jgi:hypothetical protein